MIAGIDTHKDTLAVAVIDAAGRLLAQHDLPNTEPGFDALAELLDTHDVVRVGIEGSGSFGRAAAIHLVLTWQPPRTVDVVEVPTLMTSRERRAQNKGKTDPVDSLAIARVTARETHLPPVRLTVGPAADLRAVLDYRGDLVVERTALVNRVHADLGGIRPGYQHQIGHLSTRSRIQQALELLAGDDTIRATVCRRRLQRVLDIDEETAALKRQLATMVEATGTTLTDMYGIGPVIAARLIAEVVDPRRYPNRNTFAAANGTAPVPASSGRTTRHRYNPGGNRQLNRALYTIAITQIRTDGEAKAYYQRTRAEGKTGREALRCLKRRLSDIVYKTMLADVRAAERQAIHGLTTELATSRLAVDATAATEARLTA